MGYDVSYHPIDPGFVDSVITPFLMGAGLPPTLEAEAVRIAKNRYRANAWGLGVSRLRSELLREERSAPRKSLLSRLFGRETQGAPSAAPFEFESDLYIWGRPFFITDERSETVSQRIDEYLACTSDDEVDSIARRMLDQISPALQSQVVPQMDGGGPTDAQARHALFWKLELMRQAVTSHATGDEVVAPNGERFAPDDLLANHLPLAVVELAAHFRPGWMDRGYVWPTHLLERAGLRTSFFAPATELFASVGSAIPGVTLRLEPTITQNYMLGGYVPANRVADVLAYFVENRPALLAPAHKENWGAECELSLGKLTEALEDADRRDLAFIEASEVYSGPLGQLN